MDISTILNKSSTTDNLNLGQLSKSAPLLLVFLRHSGCLFCSETLKALATAQSSLNRYQIILVCLGSAKKIEEIANNFGLRNFKIVEDPNKNLYQAIGLKRGNLIQLFGPSAIWSALKARLAGHKIGAISGDVLQLPGTAIISNGNVIKSYLAKNAGDKTDFEDFCSI